MKTVSDSDGSRMDAGRLFHTRDPSTAKDRSPNVVLVGGTSSLVVDDDDLRPDRRGRIRRQSSTLSRTSGPYCKGSVYRPLVIYGELRRSFAESSKSPQHHTRKRRLITPGVSFPRYSVLFCLTWYALGHYLNYLCAGGRQSTPRCLMWHRNYGLLEIYIRNISVCSVTGF